MNSVQTQTLSIKGDGGGEAYKLHCEECEECEKKKGK